MKTLSGNTIFFFTVSTREIINPMRAFNVVEIINFLSFQRIKKNLFFLSLLIVELVEKRIHTYNNNLHTNEYQTEKRLFMCY